MRIGILRREKNFSFSMDVYADGLVRGLRTIKPDWEITEFTPDILLSDYHKIYWFHGIKKYYERYYKYPLLLTKQDIDLFHVIDHSDGHLLYWLNSLSQSTIITCHDLINLVQPNTFRGRAKFPGISMATWKWAIRGMLKADRVVAVSTHTAQDILRNLPIDPSQISVVPNAVEDIFEVLPTEEILRFRQLYGISSETFCLLNVGSNNSRKNVSIILRVLVMLQKQGLPVHFWKVGADFNNEQKQFIMTHQLSPKVSYLGKPDKQSLVALYNAADVLVAPSLYEGFGMTLLEAMACGTAVVSSNVTSLPEVAGDAAILVNPTDEGAITAAITLLCQNPEIREQYIRKGLRRSQQFTWEKTAEQIAKVYEQVYTISS
jgi:glycosyltransferase involved in cell wall biosynthesis